jgi:hypothetical protein
MTMKLPLKMLMEECIGSCRCSDESIIGNKWVSEVRMFGSDEVLRKDILYIITGDTLPDMAPTKQGITLLLTFDLAAHLPEGYQWIAVLDQDSLYRIMGTMQNVFREFQEWYVKLCDACSFGCNLQEISYASLYAPPRL